MSNRGRTTRHALPPVSRVDAAPKPQNFSAGGHPEVDARPREAPEVGLPGLPEESTLAPSCTFPDPLTCKRPYTLFRFSEPTTASVQRNSHAHRKLCRRGVRGGVYAEREWPAPRAGTLTLADVLARAREQAPQIVSARLAVEETRGRLLGASLRLQSNPEIDAGLGNRQGTGSRFTDFELGAGQTFEPGSATICPDREAPMRRSRKAPRMSTRSRASSCGLPPRPTTARCMRTQRIRLLNATQELAAGVYCRRRSPIQGGRHRRPRRQHRARVARARPGGAGGAEAAKALALGDLEAAASAR